MDTSIEPLIIFVPGKNPKPPAQAHREQLFRCLTEGIRRAESDLAETFVNRPDWFEILAWNNIYYQHSSDIADDIPWVDQLLGISGPSAKDKRDARSWTTRLAWVIYSVADRVPALIPLIASPAIRSTIEETLVYFANTDGIGVKIRELLANRLLDAFKDNRPVQIIAHSMGSVIVYDTLWEMSRDSRSAHKISQLVTIGSPLGLRFVQKRLLGAAEKGARRYPSTIRTWVNISAMGELTALDREFADDFQQMVELGLLEDIHDHYQDVYNYYRDGNGLNVHRSYGYLVNPITGKVVSDWLARALAGAC